MIDQQQILVEPRTDAAPAQHAEVRIDIDSVRRKSQEELDSEVIQIVDRQHDRPQAIDGQQPARQKSCVVDEQPVSIGGARGQVAAPIAEDELVAVQNADGV
jgi:hypothetical protein